MYNYEIKRQNSKMKYHNYDTESNYYKIKANSMKELD